MDWAFFIIIVILSYIAYQLSQLNRSKAHELALNIAEKKEDKVREYFPHLYPTASEEKREEFRNFIDQSIKENSEIYRSPDDRHATLAGIIYMDRYKIIRDKIEAEADSKKKERMRKVDEELSKELRQWDTRLESLVKREKMSSCERDFILWTFITHINKQFPERRFVLEDYFNAEFRGVQFSKD